MWVFGYGSLMWDGWETRRGCLGRVTAELQGYARTFNKLSVPPLNFRKKRRAEIVAYLIQREGENFRLNEKLIVLEGGTTATAFVPMYRGPNVIPPTSAPEIAAMALRTKGLSGSSADYIRSVANHLLDLGIEDPAVTDLCAALVKATR